MAKATRQAFGEALAELGARHPEVVVCDADLSKSTMSCLFAKKFPQRFYEFGIQEANMIGAGAGLALAGKRPFVCSFACFLTGRYDTIRMSAAYSNAPLRLVGTHAGIGIGEDGNSQMGLEDLAIMRALPRMMVLQPADERETWAMMEYLCSDIDHPTYIRLTRQKMPDVTPEGYVFKPGQVIQLRAGSDVTICATGGTIEGALGAAEQLAGEGISAQVLNISSIKPLDPAALVAAAEKTGRIFTVEDHNITAGMGGAICEILSEHQPTLVKRWGTLDAFGESGSPEDLYAKYQLDTPGIATQVKLFLQ
jgi:transketolase